MAVTLKQIEAIPASYPATPSGLSTSAAALAPALIWQRIEAYTAVRFTSRAVTWIVEGPGEWVPPLTPATVSTVEVWSAAAAWESVTLLAAPCGGYYLPATGPYRFVGTVGSGSPSALVNEAFRRLAEYFAAKPGKAGASSESISAGSIDVSYRRDPTWLAQAMQNSGAADLLRSYRRAA